MKDFMKRRFFPALLGALVIGGIALASSPNTYAHGYHHGGGHGHRGGYCNSDCPYYNER